MYVPVASIVLFLLIIFCLLKWELRGMHFGYIYIIFGYWNESRGVCTLRMYIIFAYWNESGGAHTLDMYIIFAYYWNECGGGMALQIWHTHEQNAS